MGQRCKISYHTKVVQKIRHDVYEGTLEVRESVPWIHSNIASFPQYLVHTYKFPRSGSDEGYAVFRPERASEPVFVEDAPSDSSESDNEISLSDDEKCARAFEAWGRLAENATKQR